VGRNFAQWINLGETKFGREKEDELRKEPSGNPIDGSLTQKTETLKKRVPYTKKKKKPLQKGVLPKENSP